MSRKFLCIVAGLGFVLGGFTSLASGLEAVLPSMVVEDNNGDVVGPVVGHANLNDVTIRIRDATIDLPVLVTIQNENSLAAALNTTYFADTNCGGASYHATGFGSTGLSSLTGFTYSVARATDGDQRLYRSIATATGSSISYQSTFVSTSNACSNNSSTMTILRPATAVSNLTAQHPPPYSLR